jgi:hypothetical protein
MPDAHDRHKQRWKQGTGAHSRSRLRQTQQAAKSRRRRRVGDREVRRGEECVRASVWKRTSASSQSRTSTVPSGRTQCSDRAPELTSSQSDTRSSESGRGAKESMCELLFTWYCFCASTTIEYDTRGKKPALPRHVCSQSCPQGCTSAFYRTQASFQVARSVLRVKRLCLVQMEWSAQHARAWIALCELRRSLVIWTLFWFLRRIAPTDLRLLRLLVPM